MIQSVAGMLSDGQLITRPPFRDPHFSASPAAIAGGGVRARPGEISLAHRGVLFLDEMPEFPRTTLEALRAPLETGQTTVSRAAAHITYPARFQLIGAMNPCRCGYLGDGARECGKAPRCGETYQTKLSGPLLDRMDLVVDIQPLSPAELAFAPAGEASAVVAARVASARARAQERFGESGPSRNAEASPELLPATEEARQFLAMAAEKLRLSARGQIRALRVGRTIADLAGQRLTQKTHIAEALAYRHKLPRQAVIEKS